MGNSSLKASSNSPDTSPENQKLQPTSIQTFSLENKKKTLYICSFWIRQSKVPLQSVEPNLFLIVFKYCLWLEPVIFKTYDATRWEVSKDGSKITGIGSSYWCTCTSDKGWNKGKHKCKKNKK